MTVYVLSCGELGEGSTILGIYSTMEKAKASAAEQPCSFSGGWKQVSETYWKAGCDCLEIEEYEVE